MKAIVLVKQVPDLRGAPVGVRADGTIAREQAAAVTNPADLHAIEAACALADEVVALTMGPPAAEAVLRDAVARGASDGVLLCDRALAGSDTWATANALAAAIAHIGGADIVVCGLSALDGETGQVGPEVACRLGLPQATGCEEMHLDGDRLSARRIVEGGYEWLSMPLPAVVTVAETGYEPRYPTLPGRRRGARVDIARVGIADIGLDARRVGLDASPTKVAHMAPEALARRDCHFVGDAFDIDALVAELKRRGALADASTSRPSGSSVADTEEAEPRDPTCADPAVWVVCEVEAGGISSASAELLSKATELAPGLGGGVGAWCAAADTSAAAVDAARFGADVVMVAQHRELSPYRCVPHARVLADAARERGPAAILVGATTTGRDLAPRVAGMLDTGLAADCTDLAVGDWERRHVTYPGLLHQIRPAMAGGVVATCVTPLARPQMATVRPGVFTAVPRPCRSSIVEVPVVFEPSDLVVSIVDREVRRSDVRLADAEVVVAGGAGCDAASWSVVEDLAAAIGGLVAASRGAVEAGLAPRELQVGQTGTTVHPRLYVACGVSGALQHTVGMRAAGTVVAVNRDPDALIFQMADFGIVGDVRDAVPLLTAALKRAVRRTDQGDS